jgi:uncharacterized membrane protein
MKTARVSLFGIPAHPVLNDLPGSLLPMASVCDLLYRLSGDRSWALVGFRLLQLGNAGALAAGIFGALDLLRLPPAPEVRRIGKTHAAVNAICLPLFAVCQLQRRARVTEPSSAAMLLLLAANVGLNVAAWNGARLVHQHGVRTRERESRAPVSVAVEPASW